MLAKSHAEMTAIREQLCIHVLTVPVNLKHFPHSIQHTCGEANMDPNLHEKEQEVKVKSEGGSSSPDLSET